MNLFRYVLSIRNNNQRFIGLLAMFTIILMSVYAGIIYPVSSSFMDALPFAVILTIAVYISLVKESNTPYDSDAVQDCGVTNQDDEPEEPDVPSEEDEKDNIIETQSGS
jgi:hypothetical protein